MQSAGRALSWIVPRTKKALQSPALVFPPLPLPLPPGTLFPNPPRSVVGLLQQPLRPRQTSWPHLFHSVSSVCGVEIDASVLQSLQDEIRSLKAANNVEDNRELEPPDPFVLREKPGCVDVILEREYDHERISVRCDLLLQPQQDGGEDEEEEEDDDNWHKDYSAPFALLINLTISITKGGGPEALEISCQCHGDEYFINYISYHEDFSNKGHDHAVHEKQLSEDLKREFLFFLFLRGFDDVMALFLHRYLEKKRSEERITNLENVAAVLANHTAL